jgi:hypothetical protein
MQKVGVQIGERDARSGDYVLRSGLAEGDRLIRYPSATLKDGQTIKLEKPAVTDGTSTATEAKGQ